MRRSSLARPLTAAVAAVLISGALVGCTGFSIDGSCTPTISSGDGSSTVTATGKVSTDPNVDFPTPLIVHAPQRSVVIAGDGNRVEAGDAVSVDYSIWLGSDGTKLGSSYSADPSYLIADESVLALGDSLTCATVGSRVALATTAAAVYGVGGLSAQGIADDETLIYVIDIESSYLGKANGFNQIPQDGMPTVVTAVDGTPGISVLAKSLPSETRVETVKAGGGAVVADGDTALLHVRNWAWAADDSVTLGGTDSWSKHIPGTQVITKDAAEPLSSVVGATVGSQLLVVVPAADGSGTATIWVVDVLGITAHAG
ncbi:MAG: FKBP-type peptidyl-prolyl cis-trans isomerase [Pseudolysinimonas sp.]|uniref:FKBP-type peptidyl-prolyl cis-trans isomerase n=1 Tax=Pseudolysinimonas sp. TaxID=2680009 RepID=UPI003262EC1B